MTRSFPITAAGQSRISTGFPLATPGTQANRRSAVHCIGARSCLSSCDEFCSQTITLCDSHPVVILPPGKKTRDQAARANRESSCGRHPLRVNEASVHMSRSKSLATRRTIGRVLRDVLGGALTLVVRGSASAWCWPFSGCGWSIRRGIQWAAWSRSSTPSPRHRLLRLRARGRSVRAPRRRRPADGRDEIGMTGRGVSGRSRSE